MNNLISRQVAADELIAMRGHISAGMSVIGGTAYEMAIEALREPEREKGKWIFLFNKNGKSEWGCLNCSHIVYTRNKTERPEDIGIYYCPHCCSDNREENDNE